MSRDAWMTLDSITLVVPVAHPQTKLEADDLSSTLDVSFVAKGTSSCL
jgi:hypothetical protein